MSSSRRVIPSGSSSGSVFAPLVQGGRKSQATRDSHPFPVPALALLLVREVPLLQLQGRRGRGQLRLLGWNMAAVESEMDDLEFPRSFRTFISAAPFDRAWLNQSESRSETKSAVVPVDSVAQTAIFLPFDHQRSAPGPFGVHHWIRLG